MIIIGLLITTGLVVAARVVHDTNEDRLLSQRVREAAAVATAAFPNTQTPLASAAVLAEFTRGDPGVFTSFAQPIVAAGTPFQSLSLWDLRQTNLRPIAVVGREPTLAREPAATVRAYLRHAMGSSTMSLNDLLGSTERAIGFAISVPNKDAHYAVYGEALRPRDRRARIDTNSAFSDFDYALFLGTKPDPTQLLASSTGGTSLSGRTGSLTVPYGDQQLLVVMSPRGELGGSLLANLWWLLLLLGLALTLGAATLVERVSRRRAEAEALADENAELYASQRSVALTLQHSLLTETFPDLPGVEIAASYVAGVEGIDIGGDWYDVIALANDGVFIAVGDVSGRGLQAATTMAALRFAIRAYVAQGDGPGAVLSKLSSIVNVSEDGNFATALCATVDLSNHTMTCANAGHPQPLLVTQEAATFVTTEIGLPVGVRRETTYCETTTSLPPRGTLLFYTDGLIERRGESLDVGLARLAAAAAAFVRTARDGVAYRCGPGHSGWVIRRHCLVGVPMAVDGDAGASIHAQLDEHGDRIICLAGELDLETVPAVESELTRLVAGAPAPITFDCSSLDFMDSSGIAMLLRAVQHTGPVIIRKPTRTVQLLIEATGLQEVLQVES